MADCNCDNIILTAGGEIRPTADSATAINIANAAGTDFVTFDTASRTVKIGNSNIAGNLELPDAYAQGNPTFRVVTDHSDPGFTAIINHWDAPTNPGVLVGTTRPDGAAFQVRSGVTLTAGGLPNNSGTTRFFVGADGKVGIGTTQPSLKLEIQDGADDIVEIEKTGSGARRWVFGIGGSVAPVGGFFIADFNVAARRLVIDTGGNVGIGKTDPQATLDVNGNVRATNEIKVWDSGWFAITAYQAVDFSHNLGALPKGVTVYCSNNVNPPPGNPSIANSLFVDTSSSTELGCYIALVTTNSLRVRARARIGINEADNGVLTSGAYRVIAWA